MVNSAIGGSTNCPPHINAIARHIGVELTVKDWETVGHDIPLLVERSARRSVSGRRISTAPAACRPCSAN